MDDSGLLAHCQRVAYFARMMSDRFAVATDRQQEIVDAALNHHSLPAILGLDGLRHLEEDLKVSFPSEEPQPAEKTNIAPDILEACNALDETVEFAPFEGLSISQALTCFGMSGDPVWFRLLGLAMHHCPARFDGKAALRRIDRLPVAPASTRRLLALDKERASVSEVEAIAKTDQVLAAGLLKRANSPLYARLAEAKTIRDAIVYLGIPASCNALLAASVKALFASATLRELWKHTTRAAETAQHIALAAGGIDPEEAYLAGLIHDVGRLVIEKFSPIPRVFEWDLRENGFPMVYAEAIAYRVDHAELGGELLRRWRFPDSLIEAIRFHHRPEASRSRLAALLYLTEVVCESDDQLTCEDLPSILRRGKAAEYVGLTIDQINDLGNADRSQRMVG